MQKRTSPVPYKSEFNAGLEKNLQHCIGLKANFMISCVFS